MLDKSMIEFSMKDIRQDVAVQLQKLRKQSGSSVEEIAGIIKMSVSQLRKLEKGDFASLDDIITVASVYDKTVRIFLA